MARRKSKFISKNKLLHFAVTFILITLQPFITMSEIGCEIKDIISDSDRILKELCSELSDKYIFVVDVQSHHNEENINLIRNAKSC